MKILDIIKDWQKVEKEPEPKVDKYKECWNKLKDRLITIYSDINIDDLTKASQLTNVQISELSKYHMVNDVVGIMNSIEREVLN